MGFLEPTHLLIVAAIALLVLGPRRLASLYGSLQRARDEFLAAKEVRKAERRDG